jgi:hypothetical protein
MPRAGDYTNLTFNQLTGIRFTHKYHIYGKSKRRIWLWQCDCGNQKEIVAEKVSRGDTKSCGCLKTTRSPLQQLQHAVFTGHYDDSTLTEEQFIHFSQQLCHWCNLWQPNHAIHRNNKEITWDYHGLDRIDNNIDHRLSNVVPSCWDCNEMRRDRTYHDFASKIDRIHAHRASLLIQATNIPPASKDAL